MDDSSQPLDDDERLVLTVALTVLGLVALGAFILMLLDPMLFRDDEDDYDDVEYYRSPSWALKQFQLHQMKLAGEVCQRPGQEQQNQYAEPTTPQSQALSTTSRPPLPPPPPPSRKPSPPPSLVSPAPTPPRQVFNEGTQTPPIVVTRGTQTDGGCQPALAQIALAREQKIAKKPSFRDPASLQLVKVEKAAEEIVPAHQSVGQSTTSYPGIDGNERSGEQKQVISYEQSNEIVEVAPPDRELVEVIPPDEGNQIVEVNTDNQIVEVNPDNQQLSTNDLITPYETSETQRYAPDPEVQEYVGPETVGEVSDDEFDDEDLTQGNRSRESVVSIETYTPRESGVFQVPEEVRNFTSGSHQDPLSPSTMGSQPQVVFPETPPTSQPEGPKPDAQVMPLKTLIPRYSWRVERRRFIILNGLILVITGSIVSVLIINFYI